MSSLTLYLDRPVFSSARHFYFSSDTRFLRRPTVFGAVKSPNIHWGLLWDVWFLGRGAAVFPDATFERSQVSRADVPFLAPNFPVQVCVPPVS